MHANHAASSDRPPPGDIPARSGTAAAPSFAQALGATASRGGATRGPGGSSAGFPQGASPNWSGFQLDPQNWTGSHFLRTENAVSNFTPMPAYTPGQVAHGDHAIVGYTISPSIDDPGHIGQLHIAGVPGSAPHVSQGLAYFVPYNPGQTNGVSVPAHPSGGQPTFVLTGALTGCSFYARPDPNIPNRIIFSHRADEMHGGSSQVPPGAIGVDYNNNYGNAGAASAFAYFDQGGGRWMIAQQNSTVRPVGGGQMGAHQVPTDAIGNPGGPSGVQLPVDFATDAMLGMMDRSDL
jgi:hypothetical protein